MRYNRVNAGNGFVFKIIYYVTYNDSHVEYFWVKSWERTQDNLILHNCKRPVLGVLNNTAGACLYATAIADTLQLENSLYETFIYKVPEPKWWNRDAEAVTENTSLVYDYEVSEDSIDSLDEGITLSVPESTQSAHLLAENLLRSVSEVGIKHISQKYNIALG